MELFAAIDDEVCFARAVESHNFRREHLADARDHFERDVLSAFFDAVDRRLARAKFVGELGLCHAATLAGFRDDSTDVFEIICVCHGYIIYHG